MQYVRVHGNNICGKHDTETAGSYDSIKWIGFPRIIVISDIIECVNSKLWSIFIAFRK